MSIKCSFDLMQNMAKMCGSLVSKSLPIKKAIFASYSFPKGKTNYNVFRYVS